MNATTGKYAEVNGIKLYYEVHGSGAPLVLLHGGLGAIEMFGEVLTLLAQSWQVIAVDLQAHGRTADIDRPISLEAMADDVAALIQHLGLGKTDIMGYSMGGGTAMQVAIRHPEVVRKLVVVSAPFKRSGWHNGDEMGVGMGPEAAEAMKPTPMYQLYSQVAPRIEDWSRLVTKMGEMMRRDYDWGQDVAALTHPVLIVVGDADLVRASHAVRFFELLGGGKQDGGWDGSGMSKSQLAILPGITHYTMFASPALAAAVTPFLNAPMPAK
jgi:pimeloyl-ACP methyl ester carboxylesterase